MTHLHIRQPPLPHGLGRKKTHPPTKQIRGSLTCSNTNKTRKPTCTRLQLFWPERQCISGLARSPHSFCSALCCTKLIDQTSDLNFDYIVPDFLFTSDNHLVLMVWVVFCRISHLQKSATHVHTTKAWRSKYHQLITLFNHLGGNRAHVAPPTILRKRTQQTSSQLFNVVEQDKDQMRTITT